MAEATTPRGRAYQIAASVTDPEMPMLTLADLGVLRGVEVSSDGAVRVSITPTYSGCPAMGAMRDDLVCRLKEEGFGDVSVAISLFPVWSTDWITERGRAALAAHGVSPPGPAGAGATPAVTGPMALSLAPTRRAVHCPRCGSADVVLGSEFGSTACKAMYRCSACLEPFDHVKEI